MRFSLFSRQRYLGSATAGDQTLGTQVSKCDIRCTLHGGLCTIDDGDQCTRHGDRCDQDGDRSQWTKNKNGVRGLLYFTLQFKQGGDVPLKYGAVRIDVGMPNADPIPTVENDKKGSDPHIAVNVLGNGGDLGGLRSREKIIQGVVESRWKFESGIPSCSGTTSVTQVEYACAYNAQGDHTATDRDFQTAMVISRLSNENCVLTVHVEAIPLRRDARIFHAQSPAPKQSSPIGPSRYVDASMFQGLVGNLENTIMAANKRNAAHEVPNTLLLAPPVAPDPPANVVIAMTPETVAVPVTA
ncbi:hypothetical protein LTR10_012294 [Elasticomyces elasticus]|nr:hypothetical protein LTR10_012294 [Elasticomyces elasticus]KAK4965770.1 hypothetical protein LTR42_011783 [Elasticomyces elasticus]